MRINVASGAPNYVVKLGQTIEQTCAPLNPAAPVNLPSFASTSLPSASKYPASLIYVSDRGTLAISDGSHWFQLTEGSIIG